MKKSEINFNKLFFEFASVSFAVIFALFLNQWREDRNNQKLADTVVDNLGLELKENIEILDSFIPSHKAFLNNVDSLISGGKTIDRSSIDEKNLELTILNSSAWEMAKVTNVILYIDFEEINSLSKVYKLQFYYESIVKQYIINSSNVYHDKAGLESLKNDKQFLKTIIPIEENLQIHYKVMLEEVLNENN